MKFKMFYNDQTQTLDFKCLQRRNDNHLKFASPDPKQHSIYHIPDSLTDVIHEKLVSLITSDENEQIKNINKEIEELFTIRKQFISEVGERVNTMIFEKCIEVENEYPE